MQQLATLPAPVRNGPQMDEISVIVPLRSNDITDEQLITLLEAARSSPRYLNVPTATSTAEVGANEKGTLGRKGAARMEEDDHEDREPRRGRDGELRFKRGEGREDDDDMRRALANEGGRAKKSKQNPAKKNGPFNRIGEIIIVTPSNGLAKNITERFTRLAKEYFLTASQTGVLVIHASRVQLPTKSSPSPFHSSRKEILSYSHLCADGVFQATGSKVLFLSQTHISEQPFAASLSTAASTSVDPMTRGAAMDSTVSLTGNGGAERSDTFQKKISSLQVFASMLERPMDADERIAMVSCTTVDEMGVVIDYGQQMAYGRSRNGNEQTLFMERRLAGFALRDQRVKDIELVPFVGPYCLLVDFEVVRPTPSSAEKLFRTPPTELDYLYNGEEESTALNDLRTGIAMTAAIAKFVETAMGDITMKEVSDGSSKLRELVRSSYRELMASEKKVEEANGKLKSSPKSTASPLVQSEIVSIETQLTGQSAGKRLAFLLPKLREASALLSEALKADATTPPADPEDAIGWELVLLTREMNRKVAVSRTPATLVVKALPRKLRMAAKFGLDKIPFGYPGIEIAKNSRVSGIHLMFQQKHRPARYQSNDFRSGTIRVFWDTFCCHCCGFANEIVHLVYPLQRMYNVHLMQESECFCPGYPSSVAQTIDRMYLTDDMYVNEKLTSDEIAVWISHRDPGAYEAIRHLRRKPDYVIGRSMYEFTKMPKHHIEGANQHCDEIWVPAEWVRRMFISNGVKPDKLVIIPESVDVYFFDPTVSNKYPLPPNEGDGFRTWCNHDFAPEQRQHYKFFSNFKWEARKGWEILFEAYFTTFTRKEPVSLYILTHIWFPGGPETYGDKHNTTFLHEQVLNFARARLGVTSLRSMPHFCFLAKDLEETAMVEVYNSVDAFVMPTRGEGWGLPTIQAMAMGLPTISTNWGGQMEFMTQETSFLIELDGVEEIPFNSDYRWELGKKWAVPSLNDTKRHMRAVFDDPEYGRTVGQRARRHIVEQFSEEAVATIIDRRLQSVRNIVLSRR